MKIKLNENRVDDGQLMISDGEKMIRRKLISEEPQPPQQVLFNDSDMDASEPISDEDAAYINVMVSWSNSHVVAVEAIYSSPFCTFQKQM